MAGSANVGDVVLGVRIDDAALSAGLENTRRRIEGAAPVTIQPPTFARGGAPPPPPPIQLPRFDPAELERIRVTQGLTAVSTRRIGEAAQQARPGVVALGDSLGQAAQGAAEVAAAQAGLPPALAGLATGAGGAAALGAGLVIAGGAAVAASNEMETLKKQLTLVTGGAGAADAAFKQLQTYAQISPFETTEVVNAGKQLAAFGFTTQQAVEFTERLGDVSVATGSDIGGLVLNLGQIQSRGFANLVDINQFLQRGIPLWDLLTEATGKTRAELQALEGGIPADAILDAFRILTDEGGAYFQASETGVTALDREWASLIDTIKLAIIPIGEVLSPSVVSAITGIADAVSAWGTAFEVVRGQAEALGQNPVVSALLGIGGKIASTASNLFTLGGAGGALTQGAKALAATAPKEAEKPTIDTTARDEAKLAAQEENRRQFQLRVEAAEEAARKKKEEAAAKAARDLENQRIEAQKTKQSLEELVALQAQISPGGQGLAIAGINPQTVAQVQQIASTIDITGNKFAQSLVKGATDAANQLLKAQEAFQQAQRGAFQFLNDQAQRDIKKRDLATIKDSLSAPGVDFQKVENALGTTFTRLESALGFYGDSVLDSLDPAALKEVAASLGGYKEASDDLKVAQDNNTAALEALAAELANVPRVNVTVPTGSAVDSNAEMELRYN